MYGIKTLDIFQYKIIFIDTAPGHLILTEDNVKHWIPVESLSEKISLGFTYAVYMVDILRRKKKEKGVRWRHCIPLVRLQRLSNNTDCLSILLGG